MEISSGRRRIGDVPSEVVNVGNIPSAGIFSAADFWRRVPHSQTLVGSLGVRIGKPPGLGLRLCPALRVLLYTSLF